MPDRWSEAVVWNVEVQERAADEYSGGMDLLVERVFAIDEENVDALSRQEASTLKPCKSSADNSYVVSRSHRYLTVKSFAPQSPSINYALRPLGVKYFAE